MHTYTEEKTPSTRAPYAADIDFYGAFAGQPTLTRRVMVYPATTTTIYADGMPVLDMVTIVTADGVVDRADPDWLTPVRRKRRRKGGAR